MTERNGSSVQQNNNRTMFPSLSKKENPHPHPVHPREKKTVKADSVSLSPKQDNSLRLGNSRACQLP